MVNPSGLPTEIFCVSAEMQKEACNKNIYLHKLRNNRKRIFLLKGCLSAEIVYFSRHFVKQEGNSLSDRPKRIIISQVL